MNSVKVSKQVFKVQDMKKWENTSHFNEVYNKKEYYKEVTNIM